MLDAETLTILEKAISGFNAYLRSQDFAELLTSQLSVPEGRDKDDLNLMVEEILAE
jgi:hypothetical protein